MPVSTHEISLQGVAGAIFWCILASLVFYVLGFATVGWEKLGSTWVGLWATCSTSSTYYDYDWFRATQAMITIGLILLVASVICAFLYMFIHSLSISKNILLKVFTILGFAAVLFMVIGVIIFGAEHHDGGKLHWSYAFTIIGAAFCLVAAILAIVQMKKSNVI